MADVQAQIDKLTDELVASESDYEIAQIDKKLKILSRLKAG